ncbi:MAG: hypothetical protein HN348_32855 [Proteobacteria bacterium]|nr:hypothetical protein [Pseudomonadota bacterium]
MSDMSLTDASTGLQGAPYSSDAGYSVSGAGDVNGDGYDDVLIGSWDDEGVAYLVLGSASGIPSMALGNADTVFFHQQYFDLLGEAVSRAGDVNGDGYDDVLLGALGHADFKGAAYIVLGSAEPVDSLAVADADTTLKGEAEGDYAGDAVAGGGDINGDGYDDILVGAKYHSDEAGVAYLLLGSDDGLPDMELDEGEAVFEGEASGDRAGEAVAVVGDVNGDGFDDLAIGAPRADGQVKNAGAIYFLLGSAAGVPSMVLGDADAIFTGEERGDRAGEAVAGAEDANNDGFDDLLVGAPEYKDGSWAGAVYLLLGTSTGLTSMSLSDSQAKLTGEPRDYGGTSVAGAGDVNGDGYGDLLIGAPGESTVGEDAGAAFLVFSFGG